MSDTDRKTSVGDVLLELCKYSVAETMSSDGTVKSTHLVFTPRIKIALSTGGYVRPKVGENIKMELCGTSDEPLAIGTIYRLQKVSP